MRRLPCFPLAGLAALALLALACRDATGPQPALRVTTDRARYARGTPVRVSVENVGRKALALSGCPRPPSAYLERRARGRWDTAAQFGIVCLAIYTTQTVALAPGGRLEFTFGAADSGTFRVRVLGGVDLRYPDAVGVSGTFAVD